MKIISIGECLGIGMAIILAMVIIAAIVALFSYYNLFIAFICTILLTAGVLPAYSMIYEEYLADRALRLGNSKTRTKK